MQIARYNSESDANAFRRQTLEAMGEAYSGRVGEAVDVLRGIDFSFAELRQVHILQLRPAIALRHALPYCITDEAYFEFSPASVNILASLLAAHTFALAQLDHHFDGAFPDGTSETEARGLPYVTAAAYSIRLIYAAGELAARSGAADALFREVFNAISGFVIERMHADWCERFDGRRLLVTADSVDAYLNSDVSRLMASGYWEAMVRAPFAVRSASVPDPLLDIVRRLRRLRQLVDEIADLDEDVSAGLVTAPLQFALLNSADPTELRNAVERLWATRGDADLSEKEQLGQEISRLVSANGGFESAASLADRWWYSACELCSSVLGAHAPGYLALLDLKRAKLSTLERSLGISR